MAKRFYVLFLPVLALILTACGGGKVDQVEVAAWEASELYTNEDISDAMDVVIDCFRREYQGCTLTQISYPGDNTPEDFGACARDWGLDEAIILYTSFDVGEDAKDGGWVPGDTYTRWKWYLGRNTGGHWEIKNSGYG